MGIMVYSLQWVMQDFVHQPYGFGGLGLRVFIRENIFGFDLFGIPGSSKRPGCKKVSYGLWQSMVLKFRVWGIYGKILGLELCQSAPGTAYMAY